MTETTELPPLTDSMTAADLVTRAIALRQSVGPKAEIYLSTSAGICAPDAARCVFMSIRPTGEYGSDALYFTFQAATWPDAFAQAETWARNWKVTSRENAIRSMALAIIEITDRDGKCTEQALIGRKLTREQVLEFHEAACVRAGEMADNAPFRVVLA